MNCQPSSWLSLWESWRKAPERVNFSYGIYYNKTTLSRKGLMSEVFTDVKVKLLRSEVCTDVQVKLSLPTLPKAKLHYPQG